ncbi:HNH endonuclease [Calothrix sp. FACHB-1219]|uniref:HNH endonuclease n=1 Tax=unclassified Calothrix TaxID=2619626 RepID=UPI001689755D|nr:HNH endonuclease [Calothrix sp. FACHB-168]MBD2202876.1 HNH endonuclease [Calothrix sp. FACHB-168]MBD2216004.1 HNH endonuclease [Calothrix sp. FACHB-1219]
MTIAMQVLEQYVVVIRENYLPLFPVNIKPSKQFNLAVAGGLILDALKHIGLKIAAGGRKGKVSANRREMLRPDNNSCQYGDSNQNLTLEHVSLRSPGASYIGNNYRNRNRRITEAGMRLRSQLQPIFPPTIFVYKQFWINLQANLE